MRESDNNDVKKFIKILTEEKTLNEIAPVIAAAGRAALGVAAATSAFGGDDEEEETLTKCSINKKVFRKSLNQFMSKFGFNNKKELINFLKTFN